MIVNEKLLFEVSFMTISEHAIMTMKTDAKLNMVIGQQEMHVYVMVCKDGLLLVIIRKEG